MVISFPSYDLDLLHNGCVGHYVKMMSLLFCGVFRCWIEYQRNILISLVIVTKVDMNLNVCVGVCVEGEMCYVLVLSF